MEGQFSAEELYNLSSYDVGDNVVSVEHQAVYIGSSHGFDGGDWLNISRVFINETELFDYKTFGYLPQPEEDEKVIKLALAYPETIKAKDVVKQYEKYDWQISRMSALERFFNRKTYLSLTRELKKLEGDYMFIEQIINATSALRKAEFLAKKKSGETKKNAGQPGSY